MNINKKQSDLFQELSSCPNQCRSYDELAEILKVSTRSIWNYCVSLEEYITVNRPFSIDRTYHYRSYFI